MNFKAVAYHLYRLDAVRRRTFDIHEKRVKEGGWTIEALLILKWWIDKSLFRLGCKGSRRLRGMRRLQPRFREICYGRHRESPARRQDVYVEFSMGLGLPGGCEED